MSVSHDRARGVAVVLVWISLAGLTIALGILATR